MARYDGLAEWYDDFIHAGGDADGTNEARRLIRELLGRGSGSVLDVGCGGGVFFDVLAELGWSVVGVDESADQLRFAAARSEKVGAKLVRADATELPFESDSFGAVAAIFVSTDIEPWERVVAEAARVLRRGGPFVFLALHSTFVGPHAGYPEEDGSRLVGPGYHRRGRHLDSPTFRPGGLREKVGAVHVPLAELLNCVIEAGLTVVRLAESREDPPLVFAARAMKR